jgi:hypothetical protein
MIASFHIVHFKRRSYFQNKKTPDGIAGLRFWKPLSIGPDFNALPKDFSRWDVAKPNFRRWGFMGVVLNRVIEKRACERFDSRAPDPAWSREEMTHGQALEGEARTADGGCAEPDPEGRASYTDSAPVRGFRTDAVSLAG